MKRIVLDMFVMGFIGGIIGGGIKVLQWIGADLTFGLLVTMPTGASAFAMILKIVAAGMLIGLIIGIYEFIEDKRKGHSGRRSNRNYVSREVSYNQYDEEEFIARPENNTKKAVLQCWIFCVIFWSCYTIPPRAFSSLGPSTMTAITFFSLISQTPSCFSECSCNFQTVGFLVYTFFLSAQSDASKIHAPKIIGTFYVLHMNVTFLRIYRRKHDTFFIQHLQCPKIMRCKNQLSLCILIENCQ